MHSLLFGKEHLDSGEHEKSAQGVKHPFEAFDQDHSRADHKTAHYQSAQDSPEEHAMLVLFGQAEINEDESNHEYVVHRERQFDDVSGDELVGLLALPVRKDRGGDQEAESHGRDEPDGGPEQGFAKANDVRLAVKNAQIESKEHQNRHHENNPVSR